MSEKLWLGELLNEMSKIVIFPTCFHEPQWHGIDYAPDATLPEIMLANIQEFGQMLSDARTLCLSIGEESRETLESIAYARLEWNDYEDGWFDVYPEMPLDAADDLIRQSLLGSCEHIADGCAAAWRRLAAKWVAAADLESDDRPELVTIQQIADMVHIERKSMTPYTNEWGTPEIKASGKRSAKYDYRKILPKLKEQFPSTNFTP